jgi:cytochrome c oxidase subunit IV
MSQEKHHISSYKSHILVLFALFILTAISVAVTQLEMGPLNTLVAMIIAAGKATIVLTWFMHLKFENRLYAIFTVAVLILFLLVLYVTFFDYSYR